MHLAMNTQPCTENFNQKEKKKKLIEHHQIVHSLLTLYATGASPSTLEEAYAENHSYQIKAMDTHSGVVEELKKGWTEGCPYLSKGKYYPDFLRFFQDEIEAKGWEKVLLEYVFKGDERSEAIFGRLFAGTYIISMIVLLKKKEKKERKENLRCSQ